jgi:hypothetical protein
MGSRPISGSYSARFSRRALAEVAALSAVLLSLSLLLIYVNGFSPVLAVFFASLSLLFITVIHALLASNAAAYRKKKLEEGLVDFLYRVVYYKCRRGSYLRAVDKAVQGTSADGPKQAVDRASRSLRLGGGLASGLASGVEFESEAPLRNLRLSGTEGLNQVRAALAAHELHLSERQSMIEESSQRYAITNMFISTIVPSFLVFAFIGSAILSPTGPSMLLFSVSLLILIPISYAIGNSLLSRRLYS